MITGISIGLCIASAIVAAIVALNEWNYASDHPYAYGPAKEIASMSGAVVLLAVGVVVLGLALTSQGRG